MKDSVVNLETCWKLLCNTEESISMNPMSRKIFYWAGDCHMSYNSDKINYIKSAY